MDYSQCKGPFRTATDLILASASPRRERLLSGLGIRFRVVVNPEEEPLPTEGIAPEDFALGNARFKALGVGEKNPSSVTLGADTIVVLGTRILGKPRDREAAFRMLSELVDRTHVVITGCHLCWPSRDITVDIVSRTRVRLSGQPQDVIRAYVATDEPLDKAGSYAIQGMGAFMVESIEGSYTNVVGLPMDDVVKALMDMGVLEVRI